MILSLRRVFPRALGRRWQSSGSIMREMFNDSDRKDVPAKEPAQSEPVEYNSNKDILKHPYIASRYNPEPKQAVDLLSPLKRKLYLANIAQNNGRFVNNQVVQLNGDGKQYKLRLSHSEQRALEPSVLARSFRIKGSWKKTYPWLRIFRRMSLQDAITQCHFSPRRMAKDVGEMFERAVEDAKKLNIDPQTLVVDQIWVGKDGEDPKRLQCKGRGRTGVITSHHVHVKAVLKPQSVFEHREELVRQKKDAKLWFPLPTNKIREDSVQTADYKW